MSAKKKNRKKKRNNASAVCSVLGAILLVLLILACLPLTVPRMFGCQIYTVVSGSMEPAISTGSLVYVKNMEPGEVKEGDVIAFYGAADGNSIITHRVVTNSTVMGEFITKGDANEKEDLNPIPYSHFIGKVVKAIPGAGALAQMFTSSAGKLAAASLIGLAVILQILTAVLKNK